MNEGDRDHDLQRQLNQAHGNGRASELVRTHSLGGDAMLRLNAEGRGMVLLHLNVPNCADSP